VGFGAGREGTEPGQERKKAGSGGRAGVRVGVRGRGGSEGWGWGGRPESPPCPRCGRAVATRGGPAGGADERVMKPGAWAPFVPGKPF
jgi:hypothetical protein